MPVRLVRFLLALCLGSPLWAAVADPMVTTTWEVRRDAEELIGDLRAKRGEQASLLERVQTMLDRHGDSLIAKGTVYAPLSEVLAAEMDAAGLTEAFIRIYGPLAERRLAEIPAGRAGEESLHALALAFPGTASARRAWSRLADSAWDHGRLGAYLATTAGTGDAEDALRKGRLTAALDLLANRVPAQLPTSMELEEMWNLQIDRPEVVRPKRNRNRAPSPGGFVISPPLADLTAASDGHTLFVFDHLVGRRIGSLHLIGAGQLPPQVCMPGVGSECFVAIGSTQHGGITLTAIGRDGEMRWSREAVVPGSASAFSAPLVVDGLAIFAVLHMNEEGPELRLVAHRLSDGDVAWNAFIAKLPLLLHRAMMWNDSGRLQTTPALCMHAGRILLLSNTGIMARISTQGAVERIWTYPSPEPAERNAGRNGALRGDGRWAVATPADGIGFALILGPQDSEPRRYTGNGCGGEVVDVADGVALLVGAKQMTCLDLAAANSRWQRDFKGVMSNPAAIMGAGRALVSALVDTTLEHLWLLDLQTGEQVSTSERGRVPPLHLACNDGMLLVGDRENVSAFGKAEAFIADQLAAAERNPTDYRPLIALGKLWSAQGDTQKAYDFFLLGLSRGAPAEYAGVAARMVRAQLERDLDNAQAFAADLARLDKLAPFDEQLRSESLFWRACRSEAAKDKAGAIKAFKELLQRRPLRVSFGVKRDEVIDVQLQALAQVGLARLAAAPMPSWAKPIPDPAAPAATATWDKPGSRQPWLLTAGSLLLGYEGGVLTARKLSDGNEAWRRTPDYCMLGVKSTNLLSEGKAVPIEVLDGTAAFAAGMRTGDHIAAFNDTPIADFNRDLIPAVQGCQEGAPFTVTVLRDRKPLKLNGRLGGELVEAFSANATSALVWPIAPVRSQKGRGEGLWVAAHDLATGSELWRCTIPPATVDRSPTRPLLTADDLVVCSDSTDLIGVALRAPAEKRERWRLPGLASWLDSAIPLSSGAMLLVDTANSQARIIDMTSGETLFLLPCDGTAGAILEQTDLVVRSPGGKLACWDLGHGRLRWSSEKSMERPIAISGDAVYGLNDRKQLVVLDRTNGQQRRFYGDWAAVDAVSIAGGRLFANVRRTETGRSLVGVALAGGAVLWERQLPRGVEVRSFQISAAGVACVLAEPSQKPSVLCLGIDGKVTAALPLAEDQDIRPVTGGVLMSGAKGLTLMAATPVTPPPPLPCVSATSKESLVATAQAVLPQLQWQNVGKAAYAIARLDRSLLIFARLPPEVEDIEVRLGDAGPEIDPLNQLVVFQRHRVARLNDSNAGWRDAGKQKLPAENDVWLSVIRVDPSLGRAPGTAMQIRASTRGISDGPAAPWWLRRAWRTVAEPAHPAAQPSPTP